MIHLQTKENEMIGKTYQQSRTRVWRQLVGRLVVSAVAIGAVVWAARADNPCIQRLDVLYRSSQFSLDAVNSGMFIFQASGPEINLSQPIIIKE
jgi:hypothetical protein